MSLRNSSLSLKGRGVETYNILLDTNAHCGHYCPVKIINDEIFVSLVKLTYIIKTDKNRVKKIFTLFLIFSIEINYLPNWLITSSAKLSFLFSRPSPRTNLSNLTILNLPEINCSIVCSGFLTNGCSTKHL